MKLVDKITDDAKQKFTLVGEAGEIVPFTLYYKPTQQAWFFDLSYKDFTVTGVQLTVSPNILIGFKNLLPFGMLCASTDGFEPQFIDDFITGRISLYMLNAADCAYIETQVFGT